MWECSLNFTRKKKFHKILFPKKHLTCFKLNCIVIVIAGGVFSVFLFKRRMWPVIFGTGSGFGMGYNNCQVEFNSAFNVAAEEQKKS